MSLSSNPRVLLVDDDELIRDLYRRAFGREFDLRIAKNGAEALLLVETEEPFAVIMSDMQMPGMNGVELLRRVRTLSPVTSRILMTGRLEMPELANEAALTTVLSKPCAYPEVLEALTREVEAYNLRSENKERNDT